MTTHADEISSLKMIQTFGEGVAHHQTIKALAREAVEEAAQLVNASYAGLVCEWTWRSHDDRVVATCGTEQGGLELTQHPLLNPVGRGDTILEIDDDARASLPSELRGLGYLLFLPLSKENGWGRGAMVFGRPQEQPFAERDVQLLRALVPTLSLQLFNLIILRESRRSIEVRERILAVASHDLRTPLSVLGMAVELLKDPRGGEDGLDLLGRAERSLKTMKRLIEDLLDYAAVDSGKLRIRKTVAKASAPLLRALAMVEIAAEQAGIEVTSSILTEVEANLDSCRIEQALTNLLSNAIKFTPKGGRVTAEVSASDDCVLYTVSDNGPGIADDKQRTLFERYVTTSGKGQGVGLGLSIAQGIVAAHGGGLLVESTPGEGASFMVSLPLSRSSEPNA